MSALIRLVEIIKTLRSPQGCAWDREQTTETMRKHLLEECYEVIEAISEQQDDALAEEIGDLLINLLLVCQIGSDEGRFNIEQAAQIACEKLIRRHPHVFGEAQELSPDQVLHQWSQIKRQEGSSKGRLVPKGVPSLMRAQKLCKLCSLKGVDPLALIDQQQLGSEKRAALRLLALAQEMTQEKVDGEIVLHVLVDQLQESLEPDAS